MGGPGACYPICAAKDDQGHERVPRLAHRNLSTRAGQRGQGRNSVTTMGKEESHGCHYLHAYCAKS
eukprot:348503-Pelagomonas_calceolata.AAC.1